MADAVDDLLFDLSLTEEQRITRQSVLRFAESEMKPHARSADEAGRAPDGFYDKTMDLGLALLAIPEALGGAGMSRSPLSNMLNAEDLAQGDMSLGVGAMTPLSFVNAVLDNGTSSQVERYLSRMVDDKFHAASIALMEPRVTFDPMRLSTTAHKRPDSYVLNGIKTMVPLGADAELLLVLANVPGDGVRGFVLEQGMHGVTASDEEYMGLRALQLSRLELNDVEVPAQAMLGEGAFNLQRLVDLSRIGICAMSVGVCQCVLDYVITYCNERVAFDEPITNRQSVAFMIGNMATELEGMRLMVYRAAGMAERGLDFHKQALLTRIQCARYAMEIGTNGVQLLGGHGFIREHPCELWYRNLRAVGIVDGQVVL